MISSFHPTQWTTVLRAHGDSVEAQAALSDLCAAYYAPVVAFLRREGRDDDAAREVAHTFFAELLEHGVGVPDRERGKFRSYLLGAVKHFLVKERAAAGTEKRGGGREHVPLVNETDTAPGLPMPAAAEPAPELAFDREWAYAIIARALSALEQQHASRPEYFATLKPWLEGNPGCSQAEAAQQLGITETALKVAIHRLRLKFRELIRTEVAATVQDPADVAGEFQHLICIVTG